MRRFRISIVMILAMVILTACATGTKGKLVSSYELAGTTLKAGYAVAKPACDAGQLPVDKCVQLKKIYNDTRGAYLLAGDYLILAIETDDLVKRQKFLEEYQGIVSQYTVGTTNLLNLLIQLGVIK